MKRSFWLLASLLWAAATPAFASTSITVTVQNQYGAALPGALVAAIHFSTNGPDALTQAAWTNAGGQAVLSLTDGYQFDIFATTQGFLPAIGEQYHSPHPSIFSSGSPTVPTIRLSSAGVNGVGEIDVDVQNGAGPLVFGDIKYLDGSMPDAIAYTVGAWNGTSANMPGTVKILNVPYASTNTYTLEVYDPSLNKMVNETVSLGLDPAYSRLIPHDGLGVLDFSAAALPPQRSVQSQQTGGSGGNVSVSGVVMDASNSNPIPFIGMSYTYQVSTPTYCQPPNCYFNPHPQTMWTNADQNGNFQFYGLQTETTYYAQIYGGCFGYNGVSACYSGAVSTFSAYGASAGPNDFFYGSAPMQQIVRLSQVAGSTGKMLVYVKDNFGNTVPQTGVSLWPDNSRWATCDAGSCACPGTAVMNPGLSTFNGQATTGYVLISNLPSGNYTLQAWTQFSSQGGGTMFNTGGAQSMNYGSNAHCGTSEYRLSIDTMTAPKDVKIFDASGNQVGFNQSSVTLTVTLSTSGSGLLTGVLHFPGKQDLSSDPISIVMQPQCGFNSGPCTGGGYAVINVLAADSAWLNNQGDIKYNVSVSSGQKYYMQVTSNYWGMVRQGGGNNTVDLTSTGTASMDMTFARSGRIVGSLYTPAGIFIPSSSGNSMVNVDINANGNNTDSYGWTQISQDGSYVIGGLLPGSYQIRAQGFGGSFPYSDPSPLPLVNVTALQDTRYDDHLVSGVSVCPVVDTTTLPNIAQVDCSNYNQKGDCPPERWSVRKFPQGALFNASNLASILDKGGQGDDPNQFNFASSTGNGSQLCSSNIAKPGFCIHAVAAPAVYDFYLMRVGAMDMNPDPAQNAHTRIYFTILNSTKNVTVNGLTANTTYFWNGSTIAVRSVNLTPATSLAGQGQTTISGSVVAQNLIRQADFNAFGGNFDNFVKYVPVIALYDANGTINSAGLMVPDPVRLNQNYTYNGRTGIINDLLSQSVAGSDYSLFTAVFSTMSPFGYEIRGLTPGKTYTAVVTTPNYPPYQTSVTMGVAGSTRTLDFNLDQLVGPGATITGTVTSTDTAQTAIAAANVLVFSDAATKTTVTDSSGNFHVDGLANGRYTVTVQAAGYADGKFSMDVTGAGSFSIPAKLYRGGGSISGTIYGALGWATPALGGARLYAYDDSLNVQSNGSTELSLVKTVASSTGLYTLNGLIIGDTYKIYAQLPGYYIVSTAIVAGVGTTGVDFTLQPKPLDVEITGHPVGSNYEFLVFYSSALYNRGQAWIGDTPFSVNAATEVSQGLQNLPADSRGASQLLLDFPASRLNAGNASKTYVFRIAGYKKGNLTGTPDTTKDFTFGPNTLGGARRNMDEALIGDDAVDQTGHKANDMLLDASGGNASAVTLPAGAMIPVSTFSVPSIQFTNSDVSASTVSALVGAMGAVSSSAVSGGIYQITFSSVNYTQKGIDVTLAYDKNNSALGDLAMYHYDDSAAQWKVVPGLQTLNPAAGTITVKKIKTLASVLGLRAPKGLMARSTGRMYVASSGLIPDDSGSFAIMRPSQLGAPYGGAVIKIYNFPNPFNLLSTPKTFTLNNGTASLPTIATNGTVIKMELPAGIAGGHGVIRVYTLSGELVRELDLGDAITGGAYYYTQWDGKNRSGASVANGVYYGILSLPGVKPKDGTFKMAVIK